MFLRFLQGSPEVRRGFVIKPGISEAWLGETLILASRDDGVAVRNLDKLQARFPGSRTHLFAEGGHHTFMLFPEAYASALGAFLAGVTSEESQDSESSPSGEAK